MKDNMKKIILVLFLMILAGCSSTNTREKRISKYFTLYEAVNSNTANRYGIKNKPSGKEYRNILYTADRMDDVRKALGHSITVTSWYRSKVLNRKIGGSSTSAHLDGLAVDFKYFKNGRELKNILDRKRISYDQLIYYPRKNLIHLGFRESKRKERKQYMVK